MSNTGVGIVAAALGLSSLACGSDGASGSPGGDASASGGQTGSGGAVGSGGGLSGSGGMAGPDAAPEPITPASLYELTVGNRWTFDVVELAPDPLCAAGTRDTTILGMTNIGGREAYEVEFFCAGQLLHISVNGEDVYQWSDPDWNLIMNAPVEEGHSWMYDPTYTLEWQSAGTVTVPAGTFENCWERVPTPDTLATTTYCPGVGMVRQSGPTFQAELVSFSVP